MEKETTLQDEALYTEYENLLLERDQLEKDAGVYLTSYIHTFGEAMTALFELKIECISLKRSIAMCQQAENHGVCMEKKALELYLSERMKDYYEQLHEMMNDNDRCRNLETVSSATVEKSKRIYRKISKLLHPDVNPETESHESLMELWTRTVLAYHQNDVKALAEIEVLAHRLLKELNIETGNPDIPDLKDKIEDLKTEIESVQATAPYTYGAFLEDIEAVEKKKDELAAEINEYTGYRDELQASFDRFIEAGILI